MAARTAPCGDWARRQAADLLPDRALPKDAAAGGCSARWLLLAWRPSRRLCALQGGPCGAGRHPRPADQPSFRSGPPSGPRLAPRPLSVAPPARTMVTMRVRLTDSEDEAAAAAVATAPAGPGGRRTPHRLLVARPRPPRSRSLSRPRSPTQPLAGSPNLGASPNKVPNDTSGRRAGLGGSCPRAAGLL